MGRTLGHIRACDRSDVVRVRTESDGEAEMQRVDKCFGRRLVVNRQRDDRDAGGGKALGRP